MLTETSYSYLLIVRRECEEKLAFLQAAFASRPGVRVIPDRRVGDRRAQSTEVPVDRRRRDRRAAPPPSWDVADYVLVPQNPQR
ncbi:MAG TPA: hypothetical protein VK886_06170 [Vicinamibacterales bacterium]|nr:hypothetical protein [Vicinamibacterales bacterium]